MKYEELKFNENERKNKWIKDCIFNDFFKDKCLVAQETLKASKTTEEFTEKYMNNPTVKWSQGWCELVKNDFDLYESMLEMMIKQTRNTTTMADCGSVKIGNDNFSILIDNGYGDGYVPVGIFERKDEMLVSNMLTFRTNCEGKFNIYQYDCGNDIALELNGRYGIYSANGYVAFVKWD